MPDTDSYIDAAGDVCVGDKIIFEENVYPEGSLAGRGDPIGTRLVHAEILKDSYGLGKQQHTFTLEVIESSGTQPLEAGKVYHRKGRTIHRNGCRRQPWDDEETRKRVLAEKHSRGRAARRDRIARKSGSPVDPLLFDDAGGVMNG